MARKQTNTSFSLSLSLSLSLSFSLAAVVVVTPVFSGKRPCHCQRKRERGGEGKRGFETIAIIWQLSFSVAGRKDEHKVSRFLLSPFV